MVIAVKKYTKIIVPKGKRPREDGIERVICTAPADFYDTTAIQKPCGARIPENNELYCPVHLSNRCNHYNKPVISGLMD